MKGIYYASVYSYDSHLYRYIDDKGNDVFEDEYLIAYDFSEGMALVLLAEDSDWAVIDVNGKIIHTFPDSLNAIMQPKWNSRYDFNVQVKDSILTLYHINGSLYPPRFFYHLRKGVLFNGKNFWSAGNFSEGRCFVQSLREDKYKMGFIDTSGQFVLEIDSLCDSGDFYNGKSLIYKGLEASCETALGLIVNTKGETIDTVFDDSGFLPKYKINEVDGSMVYKVCYSWRYINGHIKQYNLSNFTETKPNDYLYQSYGTWGQGYSTNDGKIKIKLDTSSMCVGDFVKIK